MEIERKYNEKKVNTKSLFELPIEYKIATENNILRTITNRSFNLNVLNNSIKHRTAIVIAYPISA